MALSRYETALLDPALVFRRPEDIVRVPALSREQKIELLCRWQYEGSGEEAAQEGMPGREGELRHRIFIALARLAGSGNIETAVHRGQSRRAFDRQSGREQG